MSWCTAGTLDNYDIALSAVTAGPQEELKSLLDVWRRSSQIGKLIAIAITCSSWSGSFGGRPSFLKSSCNVWSSSMLLVFYNFCVKCKSFGRAQCLLEVFSHLAPGPLLSLQSSGYLGSTTQTLPVFLNWYMLLDRLYGLHEHDILVWILVLVQWFSLHAL